MGVIIDDDAHVQMELRRDSIALFIEGAVADACPRNVRIEFAYDNLPIVLKLIQQAIVHERFTKYAKRRKITLPDSPVERLVWSFITGDGAQTENLDMTRDDFMRLVDNPQMLGDGGHIPLTADIETVLEMVRVAREFSERGSDADR